MKIDANKYQEAVENNAGWCTACQDFTRESGVEPDARKYECPVCGLNTVMGIEQAVLEGEVEIENF